MTTPHPNTDQTMPQWIDDLTQENLTLRTFNGVLLKALSEIAACNAQHGGDAMKMRNIAFAVLYPEKAAAARDGDTERLADRAKLHSELVEELQTLCGEFGIHAGENRVNWLREKLARLRDLEQGVKT